MTTTSTTELQKCIDLMRHDYERGRGELMRHAYDRLKNLTRTILNEDLPELHGETEDAHGGAMKRLCQALERLTPLTANAFLALAARNIRWELSNRLTQWNRLAVREKPGLLGAQAGDSFSDRAGSPGLEPQDSTHDPSKLLQWADFHEQIDKLPEQEREVIELLFFMGMSQQDVAEALGVSAKTVQRRWRSAQIKLAVAARRTLPDTVLEKVVTPSSTSDDRA